MDKKIKGVKIKRLFCHIHLTWKLTRERKEIILLKGQENRGFKIPVINIPQDREIGKIKV